MIIYLFNYSSLDLKYFNQQYYPEVKTRRIEIVGNKGEMGSFKSDLKMANKLAGRYMIAGFNVGVYRGTAEKGECHISPLVAYNENESMVLILDVSGYWKWVKVEDMYQAMKNDCNGGGYLLVGEKYAMSKQKEEL